MAMRLDPVLLVELMAAARARWRPRRRSGPAQVARSWTVRRRKRWWFTCCAASFSVWMSADWLKGSSRLSSEDEAALTDRVVAMTVGLGPIDVLLAEEDVEEVHYTRFDHGFMLRSTERQEPVGERFWWSQPEQEVWLGHLARTAGRTERQFNAQSPLW